MKYNYENGQLVSAEHYGDLPIIISYAPQMLGDVGLFPAQEPSDKPGFVVQHGLELISNEIFASQYDAIKFVEEWSKERSAELMRGFQPFSTHRY